ncbi:glycosyl transferase [Dactylosporangium sucinum]|uniref:Glycosyl transferase n=2 Tax=Dactylosporangium sucinum TaxID=1424081 RepID=A0A917WIE0_9ACTN|nr:glycosyl transferase [Dactylosporangium sucinum]
MRIVHVSHTSQRGGAELALVRLLARPSRWDAAVCASPGGDAFAGLPVHGVPVQLDLPGLPGGGTRGKSPALAAKYLSALRAAARTLRDSPLVHEADLLHANSAAAAIICALANRRRRVPLVVHLRDLVDPESLGRFGFEAFTRIGLVRADAVVANSATTLRSAESRIGPGVFQAVLQSPSGIDRRVTTPSVADRVRTVGMIGRLQRWKGQHVFLEAFAHAFAGTDVRARLAGAALFGEAAYEEELREQAARLGIAGQVDFLGHVEDIPRFIDGVDVLVHASTRAEPLGQSVLQGLAHAKPVVATEGGGPGEWLRPGENGLLVPPGDAGALADALRTLAAPGDLRARLAAGAARTPGLLTDDECADAHAAFFGTVLGVRATASGRHPE